MSPVRFTGTLVQGGGGGAPAVISTGTESESLAFTATLIERVGSENEALAFTASLTAATGLENDVLALKTATGSATSSTGTGNEALAVSTVGSGSQSAGGGGASMQVASSIAGIGYVTTAVGSGTTAWTNPTRVEADDASDAQWVLSEGVGAGAATNSTGTITATNPKLGAAPTGFTRTKVEVLVHRNAAAVGLGAAGDTATFKVDLKDKTGAQLATALSDSLTAAGTIADATVAFDVTAIVAAISDADLALTQFVAVAGFNRTLAALGTRSWTVNVDSVGLRITYTRSGIS